MSEPNQPSGPNTKDDVEGKAPSEAAPAAPVHQGTAETAPGRSDKTPVPKWNMDLILDVELGVRVSFGEAQMALRDVAKLGVGSVIELDRGVNDPVTVANTPDGSWSFRTSGNWIMYNPKSSISGGWMNGGQRFIIYQVQVVVDGTDTVGIKLDNSAYPFTWN